MADSASLAPTTTTTNTTATTTSSANLLDKISSSSTVTPTPAAKQAEPSWRDKLRKRSEERGKERWRDASLNDKDRWKDWQKAKDKEQKQNSMAGVYTGFYKKKGSVGYWLDAIF
ncbi:hypothetical protein IQ07DRAFT_19367 [Pyrenochaeta sp. DS3sAY3a]|nr:hypothetical protein IQ07DRAFT_19367 [Pyrenochaeta sp. DS3sAY3a]